MSGTPLDWLGPSEVTHGSFPGGKGMEKPAKGSKSLFCLVIADVSPDGALLRGLLKWCLLVFKLIKKQEYTI